jgi:hypothetical protein
VSESSVSWGFVSVLRRQWRWIPIPGPPYLGAWGGVVHCGRLQPEHLGDLCDAADWSPLPFAGRRPCRVFW